MHFFISAPCQKLRSLSVPLALAFQYLKLYRYPKALIRSSTALGTAQTAAREADPAQGAGHHDAICQRRSFCGRAESVAPGAAVALALSL